jgi:hypothetical protein
MHYLEEEGRIEKVPLLTSLQREHSNFGMYRTLPTYLSAFMRGNNGGSSTDHNAARSVRLFPGPCSEMT